MLHIIRKNMGLPQIDVYLSAASAHEEVKGHVIQQEEVLVPIENPKRSR